MSGSTTGRKNDDGEVDNAVHYADDGTSFVAHQMLFDGCRGGNVERVRQE